MRRLRHILQSRYLFKILALIFLIYGFLVINYYPFKSKYDSSDNNFKGIIYRYQIKEDKIIIEMEAKEKLIIHYKFKNDEEKDRFISNISYGDTIKVTGLLKEPENSTIPDSFDYKKYLYNKKIYYIVHASEIKKIKNNNNYLYTIKNLIYKIISKRKSSDYLKVFLLSDKSEIEEGVKRSYSSLGISHIFSISGMHINFITSLIFLYLDKVTYNKKIKYLIADIFLLIYLLFLGGTSSLIRSTIMYILLSLNYSFDLKIKKVDIMLLTLVIAIIINPFLIIDIGFIYSYLISFFLIMYNRKLKNKSKFKKILAISLISFLVSFPINIYLNYEINLISIVINIILVPIVSLIILPMSMLAFLFPFFDNIYYYLTTSLEEISLLLDNINFTKIIFSKPSILLVITYYIIVIIAIKKPKYFYLLLVLIAINKIIPYLNNNLKVMMFDVGQGDSMLITFPHNKMNILIDTGKEESYSKMEKEIIPYFKSRGIEKIDYLIITHGDSDHMGEAINLVNNFKVNKVIFNNDSYNELEKELIKVLEKKNIKYYKGLKELNIDKYKLRFLNTKKYDNENDNSNIIYFNYNNYKFLFMGDAGTEREKDILDKYKIKKIDFLKVGHHGSNTSSSKYFIDSINPKHSLISVGANNRYGHPKDSVLKNLSNSKIYRTDYNGSIEIKINKNGYKIKTCRS